MAALELKKISSNILSIFSFITTFMFLVGSISNIYGLNGRSMVGYGPCDLSEIPWLQNICFSFISGFIMALLCYKIDKDSKKSKKSNGEEFIIPRMKFQNLARAIFFFSSLIFAFFFLFIIREYLKGDLEISFLQFCVTKIPWISILASSLIYGIVLSIGFYNPSNPHL